MAKSERVVKRIEARYRAAVRAKTGFCTPVGPSNADKVLWELDRRTGVRWANGDEPSKRRKFVASKLASMFGGSLWFLLIHNDDDDRWQLELKESMFGSPIPHDRFIDVARECCPEENAA